MEDKTSLKDLDQFIEQLNECKQLTETQVKTLCDKVKKIRNQKRRLQFTSIRRTDMWTKREKKWSLTQRPQTICNLKYSKEAKIKQARDRTQKGTTEKKNASSFHVHRALFGRVKWGEKIFSANRTAQQGRTIRVKYKKKRILVFVVCALRKFLSLLISDNIYGVNCSRCVCKWDHDVRWVTLLKSNYYIHTPQ